MKKKMVSMFVLSVLLCFSFTYAQVNNEVDLEDMKHQQVEFENKFRNLLVTEQETIKRKDKVVEEYTSKHLELMQETNDINFELYSVKLDQEKNYREYISFLEQTLAEVSNAQFKPLSFESLKKEKQKKTKKRR